MWLKDWFVKFTSSVIVAHFTEPLVQSGMTSRSLPFSSNGFRISMVASARAAIVHTSISARVFPGQILKDRGQILRNSTRGTC